MAKKVKKKVIKVKEHIRHVSVSSKNPDGITVVDEHIRRINKISREDIHSIFEKYNKAKILFPTKTKNGKTFANENDFDEIIAVWTDYFNKTFSSLNPLDVNLVKALIASESGFRLDLKGNTTAVGVAQITRETLKLLQDPNGEAKDFLFSKIRIKDLKDPKVAIPLAIRWLFRKKETAKSKIKREPTNDEIILEYKGLLKSNSAFKEKALNNFREHFEKYKSK